MSIKATYAINEYIGSTLATASLSAGNMYPGKFAPSSENSNKFVVYNVVPGQVYDLFGLQSDLVDYIFYNSNFDELQRVVTAVMNALNVEDIQVSSLSEVGITFQDTHFAPKGRGEAHFADGVEYFFISAELTILYTES